MRWDKFSGNHRKHTKPENEMGNDKHANKRPDRDLDRGTPDE